MLFINKNFFLIYFNLNMLINSSVSSWIAALSAFVGILLKFRIIWLKWRKQHLLEKEFGAKYFDSETIKLSTKYYIPPYCTSVDPSQEAELRHVISTEEKAFDVIDKYLSKPTSNRHLLLLADSGMGKSSFLINYYARNQRLSKRKRHRLALVPLGIPNSENYIDQIVNKKDTILFLDAFDEDVKALKNYRNRLKEIMDRCKEFKRVLITCRTQFFPSDQEIPLETGILKIGQRKLGEKAFYEFLKLYLSPFNDKQIKLFINKHYPFWSFRLCRKRKRIFNLIEKIPLLSVRPMLLAYMPNLSVTEGDIEFSFQLYEIMVEKWLERESHWVDKDALREFSEQLSVNLYLNREHRDTERIPRNELSKLASDWGIPLSEWQLTSRSLLNRDASGNYKFAHRSIMEYLFVRTFFEKDKSFNEILLTDQMKSFLEEMIQYHFTDDKSIYNAKIKKFQIQLRDSPILNWEREQQNVESMLRRKGYYDNLKNKEGLGIKHLYSVKKVNSIQLIIDIRTELTWQKDGNKKLLTFRQAFLYINELNKTKYAGFNDWRLPTLEEAMSLMENKMQQNKLYINSTFNKKISVMWTCDKSSNFPWLVDFVKGYCINLRLKGSVRAVRSGCLT